MGSKNCRACGEVVSWETATCIWKLQLCFLARSCRILGEVDYRKPYSRHSGAKFGSLAILWVMLKLSRAMAGHVEAICQMLFGHVVGFVSQSALPQKRQDFKWVLGGQMQRPKQHVGPRLGPSLAIFSAWISYFDLVDFPRFFFFVVVFLVFVQGFLRVFVGSSIPFSLFFSGICFLFFLCWCWGFLSAFLWVFYMVFLVSLWCLCSNFLSVFLGFLHGFPWFVLCLCRGFLSVSLGFLHGIPWFSLVFG